MNENLNPADSVERDIQRSVSDDAQWVISRLDLRMAERFQKRAHPVAKSRFFTFFDVIPPVLKPVIAIGVLVIVIGVSFVAGRQTMSFSGPMTLKNESPTLVATSESPGFLSIYDSLTGQDTMKRWSQSFSSEIAMSEPTAMSMEPPSGVDDSEMPATSSSVETEDIASDSEDSAVEAAAPASASDEDVASSSGAEISSINRAVAVQAEDNIDNLDSLLSNLLTAQVASKGLMRDETTSATADDTESSVDRFRASVERLLASQFFQTPKGVAIDDSDSVFVTEYQPDGALVALDHDGQSTIIKSGLVYPAGIAFGPDRSLYLAEQGRGRVLKFVAESGRITPNSPVEVFSTGFSGMLETDSLENLATHGGPFALTITPENELLVSDFVEGKTVIYRFDLNSSGNWWDWLFLKS